MKYDVCLSNDDCIFDSESGFDTIADALKWGLKRGNRYVLQIGAEDGYGVSLGVVGNMVTANVGSPWEYTFPSPAFDKIVDHVLCEIVSRIGDYGLGPDWDEVTIEEAVQALRITRKDGKLSHRTWKGQEGATRDYINAHRAEIMQYLDAQEK